MKIRKFDILLEHLNINCKYYLKEYRTSILCERAWADTDRDCLKIVSCKGNISKCELTNNHIIRNPEKEE